MNIEELINALLKIEDKNKKVKEYFFECEIINIKEDEDNVYLITGTIEPIKT